LSADNDTAIRFDRDGENDIGARIEVRGFKIEKLNRRPAIGAKTNDDTLAAALVRQIKISTDKNVPIRLDRY